MGVEPGTRFGWQSEIQAKEQPPNRPVIEPGTPWSAARDLTNCVNLIHASLLGGHALLGHFEKLCCIERNLLHPAHISFILQNSKITV